MADISTTNLDAGADSPRLARPQLLEAVRRINAMAVPVDGDGVTDNSSALSAAIAMGRPIVFNGVAVVGTPTTITVPIVDTIEQIFSTSSQVTIDNGLPVRPEWFGGAAGNIRLAVNALPSTGGVVLLRDATYPPSYTSITSGMIAAGTATAGTDYLAKANVRIQGARLPTYNSGNTALENGSIINGPFYVFAAGFEIDQVGIDSGSAVCTALYSGTAQDAFAFVQVNQAAPTYVGGVTIGSIRGLGQSNSAAVHSALIEGIDGGYAHYVEGRLSQHNVILKVRNFNADTLIGVGSTGEGVYLKSDAYAPLGKLNVTNIIARSASGSVETGYSLLIDAATQAASAVNVANVYAGLKAGGVGTRSIGAVLENVNIGNVVTENCTQGWDFAGDVRRIQGNQVTVISSTYAVTADVNVTAKNNRINNLNVYGATDGVRGAGSLDIDNATFETVSAYCLNHTTTAARFRIDQYRIGASVSAFWTLQPALAGTWVNEGSAGNPVFRVTAEKGCVVMSGFIKSGGAATIVSALGVQIRPGENLRFLCSGNNAGVTVPVTVTVSTAGVISCPDYAAAPTYISLDGVHWLLPA